MVIEIPHGTTRDYLHVFGVAAIYVVRIDADHCRVGSTLDLGQTHRFVSSKQQKIVKVFWVRDGKAARRLANSTRARLPMVGGVAVASASIAIDIIRSESNACRVPLTEHQVAMARVAEALGRVEAAMAADGQLAWFNGAYKAYRLASPGRTMLYGEARVRLRNAVVRRILAGRGLGGLQTEIFGEQSMPKLSNPCQTALTG